MTLENLGRQADLGMAPSEPSRLGVFGGTFDPVHTGHLYIASELLRLRLVSEVLFVPARVPPHKRDEALTSPEHRLEMLRRAVAPYAEFSVSDIEVIRSPELPSYTIDTLDTLRQVFPEHQPVFIIGMDSLATLHTWHRAPELVSQYRMIVYPRPATTVPNFASLSAHFGGRNARRLLESIVAAREMPVSSTEVRASLQAGRNVAGRIPESVLAYVREHGLYRSRRAVHERGAGGSSLSGPPPSP